MTDEQQFLRKILYNPFLREKFKYFETNKKYFNYYDKEEYIHKLQDLIISEIDKMTKETFDIELIISWFKNILQDYYFDDIYLLVHGKFNETIRRKVINLGVDIESYTTYISELHASEEYKLKEKGCLNKYLNFKNDVYIMNDEFERFVFALNSINDNSEDNFEYVFNMLLDKKYKINDTEYQGFFLRFSLFAMREFGLENNKVSYKNKLAAAASYVPEKDQGRRLNHIYFKSDSISLDKILENLIALFHEIKHGIQEKEVLNLFQIDSIKQIEDETLRHYLGEKFYNDNYAYISFETDAVVCSHILLSYFLQKYAPLTYRLTKNILNQLYISSVNEDNNNNRIVSDKTDDLQKLFTEFLKNRSKLLIDSDYLTHREKLVLLQVYNEDATPKTPDSYFKEKEKLLLQLQTCPLDDETTINEIKQKIDFYDAILLSFEYNVDDLKRNYIALDNYQSNNPDIMAEVLQYKDKILSQLTNYGESNVIFFQQERVIK